MRIPNPFRQAGDEPPPSDDELNAARVKAARRMTRWTELPEQMLVPRGRRFFVHAEDDVLFTRYRAPLFGRGSADVIPDQAALVFCIDRNGEVVAFQRSTEARTWSEYLEAQERRKHRPARKRRLRAVS